MIRPLVKKKCRQHFNTCSLALVHNRSSKIALPSCFCTSRRSHDVKTHVNCTCCHCCIYCAWHFACPNRSVMLENMEQMYSLESLWNWHYMAVLHKKMPMPGPRWRTLYHEQINMPIGV